MGSMNKLKTYKSSNSQAGQDMFVLNLLQNKRKGVYVEIGSGDAIKGNNTLILERSFDWNGLSIEIDESLVNSFRSTRKNKVICADAAVFDFEKSFDEANFPIQIDYLQVDVYSAAANLGILKRLLLSKYRFSIITFEHDLYRSKENRQIKECSEKILEENNYFKYADNVKVFFPNRSQSGNWVPFEDWWVDSKLFGSILNCPSSGSRFIDIFDYSFKSKFKFRAQFLLMQAKIVKNYLDKFLKRIRRTISK